MQVFVHDLGDDVQPARRGVAVEQDAQPHADDEDVAQHVQLLAVGQGAEVREEPLEQADKRREHDAGVDRLGTELPPAGQKPDDEQHDIQNHRDG